MIDILRENEFSVIVIEAQGKEEPKDILKLDLKTKILKKLKDIVYNYYGKAFITVNNINPVNGGYFYNIKKK